jgi:TonB family protein
MSSFSVRLLAATFLLSGAVRESPAQSATSVEDVVITKLFQPVYPPLAKQTRATGNVELTLEIRKDGSIESASVVSGHPLLQQAALDSARRSQFECKNCGEGVRQFQMLYSFQLGPTSYCTEGPPTAKGDEKQESYPRVTQLQNHITLVDQPVGTCDLAFVAIEKKVRSAKCLYLWRCGSTNFQERPLASPR